jgi:hypothetical protein
MKKIFFAIITCALLIPVSAKHVYFYETFGNVLNSPNLSTDDCKDGNVLYYSTFSPFATSSDTTVVFGYYPAGGLSIKPDYTDPYIRVASKWVTLNGNVDNWVAFDWLYTATVAPDATVSTSIVARVHPDSAWVTVVEMKGAGMGFNTPENILGKLPSSLVAGTDSVQVAAQLRYTTVTSIQWMFYMDNFQFVSYDDENGQAKASLSISSPGTMIENITNYNIIATLTNESSVVVDSVVIGYTINNGPIQYQRPTLSNKLNVLGTSEFKFNHSGLTNADIGDNEFELWIAKLNDVDFTQGEIGTVNFSIYIPDPADAQYPTKFLVEHFTSSTCPPCKSNNTTMTPYYEQQDAAEKLIYIKYQMNWPGDGGDPYYVAQDGGVRRDYYEVDAVPTMVGNAEVFANKARLTQRLNAFDGAKSYLDVSLDSAYISQESANQKDIYLEYTITPKLTTEATIHTVVFENVTYNNKRTNGETEFHHVVMKMFPDGNGNVFQLKKDSVHKFVYTYNMSSTHVEEVQDLQMVVFVQNDKTGEIYVAAQREIGATVSAATEKVVNTLPIKTYPNPTTDELTVESPANSTLLLYNNAGILVYEGANKVEGKKTISLVSMPSGIYTLKVVADKGVATQKIIKK